MPTFQFYVDYTAKTSVVITARTTKEAETLVEGKLIEQIGGPVDTVLVTHIDVIDTGGPA